MHTHVVMHSVAPDGHQAIIALPGATLPEALAFFAPAIGTPGDRVSPCYTLGHTADVLAWLIEVNDLDAVSIDGVWDDFQERGTTAVSQR